MCCNETECYKANCLENITTRIGRGFILETITELRVEEKDIDELGHVNNSVYVTYLEEARGHWYKEAGLSFKEMGKRGLGTVVLKLEILFKKEALLGDLLKIKTSPIRLGNKSFDLEQTIYNQSGDIVSEAIVKSVMFDRNERKSIPVSKEIADQFKE